MSLPKHTSTYNSQKQFSSLKISFQTKEKINEVLQKLNDKDLGKKITAEHLINFMINKVGHEEVKLLQEISLTNADKMELKYRQYVLENEYISKDEFIGKLLSKNTI